MNIPILRAALLSTATLAAATFGAAQAVDTFHNRNLPDECDTRMRSFVAGGQKLVCVAFPPAGGNSWTVVTEQTFFNRNVPQECHDQMVKFVQASHKILCVAYPPGGGNSWSIITDKGYFNRNVPQECHDQMGKFVAAGHKVKWVAYPPVGGNSWSILTDKGYFNRNVPQECHDTMGSYSAAGQKIECVAYPPAGGNRWTILTDKSFFNRAAPTHLHNVMRAMFRFPGGPLSCVAFTPDGNGFTAISDTHPNGIAATIKVGNEYFSLDKFSNNLKTAVVGKGVKAAFAIRFGSATRSFATGAKRTAYTAPAQDFSIYDRFNPASVSKTIAGVAVLRALQNKNVSINEYIYKYLPSFWSKPASVKTITFKELLNHTSGFRAGSYGYDYAGMQAMVAAGINPADKVSDYENVNYALARIVCAYLDGYSEAGVLDHGKATSDRFIAFVQTYLMDNIGAPAVQWEPDAVEPTLWFPNPAGTSTGTTYGDWSLRPGSAGVHMSIAELNIFLDTLKDTTAILGAAKKTEMDTYNLGWDGSTSVKHGFFKRKGGYFPGGPMEGGGVWNGGAELHAYVASFDNGIEVSAVINGYTGIDIAKAYNDAWAPLLVKITSATTAIANVTTGSIVVSGENMDVVDKAVLGPHSITSTDDSDPTKPWFKPLSSTTLLVHTPQGLAPGAYSLSVATDLVSSNATTVNVIMPRTPTLIIDSKPTAGQYFKAIAAKGAVTAPHGWLALSPSSQASVIPGIFDFDIGAAFQLLLFWPEAKAFDKVTEAVHFNLPSAAFLKGETWYFQLLYATPTFPLAVSNVAALKFQ